MRLAKTLPKDQDIVIVRLIPVSSNYRIITVTFFSACPAVEIRMSNKFRSFFQESGQTSSIGTFQPLHNYAEETG